MAVPQQLLRPPRHAGLRVSDADRDRATELLREHWVAGRLDVDELDARLAEVCGARFDYELNAALRELPVAPRPAPVGWAGPTPYGYPDGALEPGDNKRAGASLVISIASLWLLAMTFGLLWIVTLPASFAAVVLGVEGRRRANRLPRGTGHGMATAGLLLGIAGTAISGTLLAGCAMVVS